MYKFSEDEYGDLPPTTEHESTSINRDVDLPSIP